MHGEQRKQDDECERHDIGIEGRGRDLDTFDGGQHRKRRGDHRVAIKQRTADDAQQDDGAAATGQRTLGECHQRQRPALAVVVGPHQDEDVFQRHNDDQRPEDQRQHADHRVGCHAVHGGRRGRGFAEGVQRAGADIAIHHANATQHQRPEAGGGMALSIASRRRGIRGGRCDLRLHEGRTSKLLRCTMASRGL